MDKKAVVSIRLDARTIKKDQTYPVKLRVFTSYPKKRQKLYSTEYSFTKEDFKAIWETTKPRKVNREIRDKLQAIETKAREAVNNLPYFSFEAFENILFGNNTVKDVQYYYNEHIEAKIRKGLYNTASQFKSSLKNINDFNGGKSLMFREITPRFLEDFQRYCIDEKGIKQNTVASYLINLRAIFNKAINAKDIHPDYYPFGKEDKGLFEIKRGATVKKALSKEQLKAFVNFDTDDNRLQRAKDFFFFSFYGNGINFKDIALLKYGNLYPDALNPERIVFVRSKTGSKQKQPTNTTVYLNAYLISVIEKYGNPDKSPEKYIFDIIDLSDNKEAQYFKIKQFVKVTNQQLKILGAKLGLPSISTYFARHSFATNAINNGASMEFVSKALSHANMAQTETYFAGFDDKTAREMATKAREI